MSSGGRGNPRRTPSRERYERFNNSHEEIEMQQDVSNIAPTKAALDKHETSVFAIPGKDASLEALRRWRQATWALNCCRRFRYTLDLKRAEEDLKRQEESLRKIRTSSQVVRAALVFKGFVTNGTKVEETPPAGYGIGPLKLANLVKEHDTNFLEQNGGVNEVAKLLHTDIEKGIKEDPEEFEHRRNAYGANTYPRNVGRNFFVFLWEACQDTTLIILMVCAALSLVLGIKTEGIKEGWFDGGSISFAVILVILVTDGASLTVIAIMYTSPIIRFFFMYRLLFIRQQMLLSSRIWGHHEIRFESLHLKIPCRVCESKA